MTEAEAAARAWGGRDLHPMRDRENAVYRMTLPDGRRAALRLHRAGYQSEAAIRSELWWCGALADADLPVPRPLATLAGAQVFPGPRLATAVSWLDGDPMGEAGVPLPDDRKADLHHALGRLIRTLHDATDALTLPPDFTRPRWDRDGLTGETPFWGRFWDHPALTPPERAAMARARDDLRAFLTDAGPTGLVHADVLRENVLVAGRALSLIDFDDSGFGYRLYDLGTVMSQNLSEPGADDLCAALAEGYGTTTSQIKPFTLARTLASVGWAAPRLPPDHPVHRRHIERALACARSVF